MGTRPTPNTGLDVDALFDGVRAGKRSAIGRAITLIESRNPAHGKAASTLLARLLPYSGASQRVGISGVPGVGKSTFIESLGCMLADGGQKVAVLAVDPSSGVTGGSILGDKTRMEQLSTHANAFVRPSPSAGVLGGVARATMETIILLEAAGFDTVLVETVGTGQSETMVSDMVDFFLVLMLPGAGDDLQGIKKGILELADMIAVNKADAFESKVNVAVRDYKAALRILAGHSDAWQPPVLPVSGLKGDGLEDLWGQIEKHQRIMAANGMREKRRQRQRLSWFERLLGDRLLDHFKQIPAIAGQMQAVRSNVLTGDVLPNDAVLQLISVAFNSNDTAEDASKP